MSKKFPYGYDINVYIDKAFEKAKELYPWAEKSMLRKNLSYAIEKKENGRYAFVRYFKWSKTDIERKVLDCDSEGFIKRFIDDHGSWIEMVNPVKETLNVIDLIPRGTMIRGWYMECYEFRSHVKGGYSVFLQAGDRSGGASRTIFIPPAYFKLSWDEFLDKYGDKYDIKAIKGSYDDVTYVDFDPNEEMSNQDEIRFHCVNKDDNNIILFVKVQAKRANKPGTIRDNPVYEFSSTAENNINDFTWFAGGISHKSTNPAYRDEIINIMKDDGIISAYDTKEYENTYREIDTGCNTIEVDSIIRSAEKNMYGEYPAYIYRLTDNSNASNGDVTFVLAKQYFLKEVDTSLNSDKMRETLKDPDGDGKIVVENQ